MREDDARRVLLVQTVEETDAEGALLSFHERTEATRLAREAAPDSPEAVATLRARRLCEHLERRGDWCRRALRLTRFPPLLAPALLGLGLAVGLLTNALGPERRINVLALPVLGLLAWNVAVYLALILRALWRRGAPLVDGGWLGEGLEALVARSMGRAGGWAVQTTTAAALALFARRWTEAAAPLIAARVRALLHVGAAAAAAGAVLGMYVRGVAFEYRVTWESTFLGAEEARALLALVLGPAAALLGIPLPDVGGLRALRAPATGEAAPWIHLYAATALLVIAGPRLALAAAAAWRARGLARQFPLALESAYFLRLLADVRGHGVRVGVVPYSYRLAPRAADRLRGLLHDLAGAGADIRMAPPVDWGAGTAELVRAAGLEETGPIAGAWLVVVFSLGQTPEPEVHGDLLAALAAWAAQDGGRRRIVLVTDAAPYRARMHGLAAADRRLDERRQAWDRVARGTGLGIAHVDLDHADEAGALGRLQRALRPAAEATR